MGWFVVRGCSCGWGLLWFCLWLMVGFEFLSFRLWSLHCSHGFCGVLNVEVVGYRWTQHFNYRCSHRSAAVASCKFVGEIFFRCESACFGSIFPGWEPLQVSLIVFLHWKCTCAVFLCGVPLVVFFAFLILNFCVCCSQRALVRNLLVSVGFRSRLGSCSREGSDCSCVNDTWLMSFSARVLIRKQSCMQRSCVSLCEVVSACGNADDFYLFITSTRSFSVADQLSLSLKAFKVLWDPWASRLPVIFCGRCFVARPYKLGWVRVHLRSPSLVYW